MPEELFTARSSGVPPSGEFLVSAGLETAAAHLRMALESLRDAKELRPVSTEALEEFGALVHLNDCTFMAEGARQSLAEISLTLAKLPWKG